MNFNSTRRQQFLTEEFYRINAYYFGRGMLAYEEVLHSATSDAADRDSVSYAIADDVFRNFLLDYTAGAPIHTLRADLDNVVSSLEQHVKCFREYQKNYLSPLRFSDIGDYEWVMQMIGFCYLLHRRDLLQRIAVLFDDTYAAKDTLYEDLLSYELDDRFDVDRWYHEPYRDLINSLYRETAEESIADLRQYLSKWYDAMENATWHDGHLRMGKRGGGGYCGYWAIEAAAVAYLLELDDSSFRENIVYPKDLVDYARALERELETASLSQDATS